ncbi:putative pentatricopeptide repeat-containing protein At3g05240 [Wolffia australiana]
MVKSRETIISLLESCRSMRELKQIQGYMTITALAKEIIPLSRLLDFCTNPISGDLNYALSLFLRIDQPTVFIWNSMIKAFSASARPAEAIALYRDMQSKGHKPDNFTFPFVLRSCAAISNRRLCGCVHSCVARSGYASDIYVATSLISGYAACGDLESAEEVFEEMPRRNVVSWTAMVTGYAGAGRLSDAARLLREMGVAGVEPNELTMASFLAACAQARDLSMGRCAVGRVLRLGLGSNPALAAAVISMYARGGSLSTSRKVFDITPQRSAGPWNAMISAYSLCKSWSQVMKLFREMRAHGVAPDKVTVLTLLRTCAQRGELEFGEAVHAYLEKTGYDQETQVKTSLSQVYAKAGDAGGALRVFQSLRKKDVVAWTGMISGLGSHGRGEEAMVLFEKMMEEGVPPDDVAFVAVLSACSHSGLVEDGRRYFDAMNSHGISPSLQHYGCLVDLLSRAGRIKEAEKLVESMPSKPNIAIWSAILSGCRNHDEDGQRLGRRVAELSPLGSGIYALLSHVHAAGGRWDTVHSLWDLMKQKKIEKLVAVSRNSWRLKPAESPRLITG